MRRKVLIRYLAIFAATFFAAFLIASQSWAARYDSERGYNSRNYSSSSRDNETEHLLSTSAGVSSPSGTIVTGSNPAGLIYNLRPKLTTSLATGPGNQNAMGTGAQFFIGDGNAAGTLGVQSFSNVRDQLGNLAFFNFGLATYSEALNMALGLNGRYRFTNVGQGSKAEGEETWTANAGLIYNPQGDLRIGFNVYDVSGGADAFGVGLATSLNRSSVIAIDASTNSHGKGLTIKPGISMIAASFQMSYSYGAKIDNSAQSGIRSGNTLGLGFEFSPTFQLQGYYNHISLYQLEGTIRF